MKNTEYKLNLIGKYMDGYILLNSAYADGLLHLDKFSHAIVIFSEGGYISCGIGAINHVDLKDGKIKTDVSNISNNAEIYDIKPYFPCEDRVKYSTATAAAQTPISSVDKDGIIRPVGIIVRRDGEYLLKLDNCGSQSALDGCSHIRIFWWFDRFDKPQYRKATQCNPPYENAPRTGVFASRSPVRPNPIAMTTARILEMKENEIRVTGLDCFDGTPLLGILPYNPASDLIDEVVVPSWLEHWPKWVDDRYYNSSEIALKPSALQNLIKAKASPPGTFNLFEAKRIPGRKPNIITIRGARQNNLKGIDVEIPYNQITAVTGVSGSGKSSLAFDTIYTECRRRFLDVTGSNEPALGKPDFDSMEGVLPAVAVSQKSIGRHPRSTVGTITDMHDHLRVLFAAIGVRHCPDCGEAIIPMSTDEIVTLLARFKDVVIMTRAGKTICSDNLRQAVEEALQLGSGAFCAAVEGSTPLLLQTTQMCYNCDKIMFKLTPATFSFNNPESMCPVCNGYGVKLAIDADAIIANPDISILDGASPWWGKLRTFKKNPNHNWMKGEILALALDMDVDLELPWNQLPDDFKHQALYGSNGRTVRLTFKNSKSGRNGDITRPVEGAYHCIKRLYGENASDRIAAAFMKQSACPHCNGERLNREGRMVTIGGTRFPETSAMPIADLKTWCEQLPHQLSEGELGPAAPILQKLQHCLGGCMELGLGYLTLDRSIPTLSGGELQRLKLVTQLGGDISGVLYVLDEPTSGLHPKDYEQLIKAIRRLRDNGNTVLLVEHNGDIIKIADHIIDIGPGPGAEGGCLVGQGTLADIMRSDASETGRYLSGKTKISMAHHADLAKSKWLKLGGIRYNNLKSIAITFPAGSVTCVTGVSGSGKSSLVKGVLFPAVENCLAGNLTHAHCDYLEGAEDLARVVLADQSPIGRTPRSVPATYMGIMDELRNLLAQTAEAQAQGLTPGHFSFNSPLGQCENCHGDGMTAAAFMDQVWLTCPVCSGKRYKSFVLEAKLDGMSIFDILSMSVMEAAAFFSAQPKLAQILDTMIDVGLGYLKLGQNSATLSGGEAQRLKLAKNLCTSQRGRTLYLLDEPTTGLHYSDIQNLLLLLRKLADRGHTVVIIEHNPDVIRCADWVVDLGPEGGANGGHVLAQGTPQDISRRANSHTGRYLYENIFNIQNQ